jgi:hypothetical protein
MPCNVVVFRFLLRSGAAEADLISLSVSCNNKSRKFSTRGIKSWCDR